MSAECCESFAGTDVRWEKTNPNNNSENNLNKNQKIKVDDS